MSGEGRRDGAELRSERKPSDSAVGQEKVAPVGRGRGRHEARVGERKGRQWTEAHGKVSDESVKRVRGSGRGDRGGGRSGCESRSGRGGNRVGGNRGDTFQRVSGGKDSRVIGGRACRAVSKIKLQGNLEVLGDERMVEAGEAIDVSHHTGGPMENLKEVAKKLLGPSTDLMDRAIILQYFFDGAAIAKPKEFSAPKKFAVLTNSPAPTTGFSDERMEVAFALGAAAGAKADGPEPGTVHSEVKDAATLGAQDSKSGFGGIRGVRLHEDPTHAGTGPISLQETRERGVVASEAGRRGDGEFQLVPKLG
jgi:hypothetical protein